MKRTGKKDPGTGEGPRVGRGRGDLVPPTGPAETRAFLAAIVESSDDAIVGKTLDGVIRSWNPAAERLFGYPAEEAVGRHITLIIPPEHRAEEEEILARLRRGERIDHLETVRLAKDGREVYVSLNISPILDASGRVVGASKVARDIGERVRAERDLRDSEESFRTLADNIAQFAWMADPSGAVFWYNERWFEYTGTTFEEMEGWGWRKVHHPDHVERVTEQFRRAIEAGEEWEDTFPLRGKDGRYRWFLSRALPIRGPEGEVLRWFGTNTDVSERMAMEEALRRAHRRKDEFLAVLAHELRNPLAPIASGLELLRRPDGGPERTERVLGILERQTRQLARLVDDLLDLSRITRGKIELRRRRVSLADVIESAVETSRPALDKAEQTLEIELPAEPIPLDADPTRLAQVFSNLLNNAARYSSPGGRVRVSAERRGDEVEVTVADTGAGLEPEMVERIFDVFVQGEEERRRPRSGLGIGLTLVRSLAELHGGRVEAKSDGLGRGSEFTVRLPAASGALPEGEAVARGGEAFHPLPPLGNGARLRVLIVDDNRDAADALCELLEILGHEARAVYDGDAALAAVAEVPPHVVLLDLGMPGLDGYETARRLRQGPGADALLCRPHRLGAGARPRADPRGRLRPPPDQARRPAQAPDPPGRHGRRWRDRDAFGVTPFAVGAASAAASAGAGRRSTSHHHD